MRIFSLTPSQIKIVQALTHAGKHTQAQEMAEGFHAHNILPVEAHKELKPKNPNDPSCLDFTA